MSDVVLPKSDCPTCAYEMDRAKGLNCSDDPEPGDTSICFNCGALLIYADNLTSRLPTESEIAALKRDSDLWFQIQRAQQYIRARKP